MKLLIVDDEPIIVRGLAKLLPWREQGFDPVLEATQSQEALHLLAEHQPDLMISDIAMPGLTGIDLLSHIRREGWRTQVIFLSGHQSFTYARDALTLGALDYLLKPVDAQALTAAVQKARDAVLSRHEQDALKSRISGESREEGWLEALRTMPKDAALSVQGMRAAHTVHGDLCYQVICVRAAIAEGLSDMDAELTRFSVYSRADAYAAAHGGIPFLRDGMLGVIVQGESREICTRASLTMGEGIAAQVKTMLPSPLEIAVSGVVDDRQAIPTAYAQARKQLLGGGEENAATKVKQYIAQNFAQNLTLEMAASVACMNASYFSSFFKRQTSEGFKDYLTRIRIEEASRLLRRTDLRVYEIADRVGFADPRHFAEVFRKLTGVTPQQYKSQK